MFQKLFTPFIVMVIFLLNVIHVNNFILRNPSPLEYLPASFDAVACCRETPCKSITLGFLFFKISKPGVGQLPATIFSLEVN